MPPATYGTADGEFPVLARGYNTGTGQYELIPASYRYQMVNNLSTIVFPTLGVGYEVFRNFRVGAAFISGIEIFDNTVGGILQQDIVTGKPQGDNDANDSLARLRTKDLFVPGGIVSLHWSPTSRLDVAAWGRWISDGHSTQGTLVATTVPYKGGGTSDATLAPTCPVPTDPALPSNCPSGSALVNQFSNTDRKHTFQDFRFPYPPEVRVGIRYHVPGSKEFDHPGLPDAASGMPTRDPLHSEMFDVELDGSYALNSAANTITVRFAEDPMSGQGVSPVKPVGTVPPNADKWNGYINSFGVRLGGQYNVIRDKLGIRAGTWIESQSQQAQWLEVFPVGATRGGFGGGLVFHQDFIDISMGVPVQLVRRSQQ